MANGEEERPSGPREHYLYSSHPQLDARFNSSIHKTGESSTNSIARCFSFSKKLKKNKLKSVQSANMGWSSHHDKCFISIKEALEEMMTLAHPKDGWIICIFPDSSDQFWSIFMTQIPESDLYKPYFDQAA